MPSIAEAVTAASTMSGYMPSSPSQQPGLPSANTSTYEPVRNTVLRCPMPPLWAESSDSQRQFYVAGQVPQLRILTPQPLSTGSGGATNITVAELSNTGGNSSGGGTAPSGIAPVTATLVTPALAPNASFSSSMVTSNSFQLLSASTATACRIQFYGTGSAQMQDGGRALDVPPAAGTSQNILADVVLDTAPYQWSFQGRVGANADDPQQGLLYTTVTNLSASTTSITVTLQYAPIETT